jgi:hypothetical protein
MGTIQTPARADRFQKKLNREMEEVFIRNAIEFGNMRAARLALLS